MPGGQASMGWIYLKLSFPLIFVTLYFLSKNGLYRSQRFSTRMSEIAAVIKANGLTFICFILLLYLVFPAKFSRITLAVYYILSTVVLIAFRLMVRNFLRSLRSKGKNLRHLLFVGNGEQFLGYIETIRKYKDAGINIIGWIDSGGLSDKFKITDLNMSVGDAREKYNPDFIVMGYPAGEQKKAQHIITKVYNDVTNIQILPDISNIYIGHDISNFAGIPIITINSPTLNILDLILKRVLDLFGALVGLIILSPFLLLVSALVKLTSKGPIFYGQERITLSGKPFTMWKFRSMNIGAESQSGAVWAVKDDPRRTKFGTFLRSSSIDELPQLWNVLIGDMSLVGPRPERPIFVDQFRHEIPAYMLRHKMRAGITGWAQVNGLRGDTSLEKRIEFDIYYIKHWSFWMDIKILFMTIWTGFINKNAY